MKSKLYFSINNLTKYKIPRKFLNNIAYITLFELKIKKSTELALIICDSKTIRRLNRIYRKKNKITDVLAFGLGNLPEKNLKKEFISPPDGILHLGDVVICYQKTKEQARKYGHSVKKELAYLLIHGILHLVGYDHKKEKDREEMEKMEEKIMNKVSQVS